MSEQHASPETIRLFLCSELSVEETSVLIRHLLSHCPQCLRAAGALAWRSPQPLLPSFRQANPRRGYGEAFAATERRLAVRDRELTRQRAVAGDQWQELRRHPPLRRRWRIRNDPRFGTWGFCERLLNECLALGRRDPRLANELAELGVEAVVISHPVYPSDAARADDGQTVLALGVIRPYKGLADAIEVTRRLPEARLLVAGDPAMPLDGLRGAERVDWRLGFLSAAELDRALSETTVAVFPYRAELDQSGALLQALGAGVPAVVYDVAGLGEPVRTYGAGRVVPAGDLDALTAAVGYLLSDRAA
ncbi:MAG TPA: glycosyltransferase, partial [Thermoanaerobaculia bacterium]